jgi:hypothetical protein
MAEQEMNYEFEKDFEGNSRYLIVLLSLILDGDTVENHDNFQTENPVSTRN